MKTAPKEAEMLIKVQGYVNNLFGHLSINRISKGSNYCYRIGNPPVYALKVTNWNGDAEQYVLRRWQEAGIPIVPLVRYDSKPEGFDNHDILITKYVEHDQDAYPTMRQRGSLLRRIHAIEADGFGNIEQGKGQSQSWREFLERFVADYKQELENLGLKHREYTKGLEQLPEKNVLLHGDLRKHNILMQGNKVKAIIDPHGVVGDPLFDVAMSTYEPEEDLDSLLAGYNSKEISENEIKRIRKYQELIRLHKIGWLSSMLAKEEMTDEGRSWFEKRRKSLLDSLEKQK